MKFNRLEHFRKDARKVKLYRQALALLYEIQIDCLLGELNSSNSRPISDSSNVMELNALNNMKALGYAECLSNLFELDTIHIPEGKLGSPDFGAREKMIAEGLITEEDANSIFDD